MKSETSELQLQGCWRPQDGQVTRRRFSSSMFFPSPAFVMSHAAADVTAMSSSMWGSIGTSLLYTTSSGMWMCPVVQLAPPRIGYVGVKLGSGQIGVPEHFLN